MLVLALDTSSPATSCALVELAESGTRVLEQELILPPTKAGDLLPDALVTLCTKASRTLEDVTGLAVGIGPGSFTGLRVGLASAKGLAYARRWPLAGASSLHALALGSLRALKLGGAAEPTRRPLIVPALEARKGELFVSAFRIAKSGTLESVAAEQVLMARDLPAWLAQPKNTSQTISDADRSAAPLLVGPGAAKNLEMLRSSGVPEGSLQFASAPLNPSAAAVAELCASQLLHAAFDAAALFALAPLYLAQSEPEKALAAGRVGKLP